MSDPFAPPHESPRRWPASKYVIVAGLAMQFGSFAAHVANIALSWPTVPPFPAGVLFGLFWGLAMALSLCALARD